MKTYIIATLVAALLLTGIAATPATTAVKAQPAATNAESQETVPVSEITNTRIINTPTSDPENSTAEKDQNGESLATETTAPSEPEMLSADDAKKIALNHAGVSAKDAKGLSVKLDEDDGIRYYDVEFRSGDYEYDYEIHAYSGKILSHDKEHDPVETKPKETEPPATETTAPSEPEMLSADDAKKIALNHAGVSAKDAKGLSVKLDEDDGIRYYDVEFRSGDYEYDYEIHAYSGKILSHDKEHDPVETKPKETEPPATETTAPSEPEMLSADDAKKIALNHAGVSAKDAKGLSVKLDEDDGIRYYDVEFRSGDYEYDYEIHAYSGKILSHDKEHDPVETKPKETEPPATETTAPSEPEMLSADDAKKIALNHAGVSAEDAKGLSVKLDEDDGVIIYEIEFRAGKYEYEYEIDAKTGAIITADKEKDD